MPIEIPELVLHFHGRIIDSLGIQMYQSPVAAIAELIANAWDADAELVEITLPTDIGSSAAFALCDNGNGMTHKECQDFYLKVGRNKRETEGDSSASGRPVLGRKGIGKFAGFGIANILEVETISKATGERTVFRLNHNELRGEEFVGTNGKPVEVLAYDPPSEENKKKHGTKIYLRELNIARAPYESVFIKSMARRFLLAKKGFNFEVFINGKPLPDSSSYLKPEFDFPSAYEADEQPKDLAIVDGWGIEKLSDDNEVRWRFTFLEDTIGEEEFQGISVYCGIKVAQTPFFFQLAGGLSGQHGLSYLTGTVQADYIDHQAADIITTERQRINWEDPRAVPLRDWGRDRIKSLLAIWKERRAREKEQLLEQKLDQFGVRLSRLQPAERKTVKTALKRLASIDTLKGPQFVELASAVLTAWEKGRLRQIVTDISETAEMDEGVFLTLLIEAQALQALNMAEGIETKVNVIRELRRRIANKEIENSIRDYIATNPWLLSRRWELFSKEERLDHILTEAAVAAGLDNDPDLKKRIDMALRSGDELLIVEFMRPGLSLDRDHIDRLHYYFHEVKSKIEAHSMFGLKRVSGLIVADKIDQKPAFLSILKAFKAEGIDAATWGDLLALVEADNREYLDTLVARSSGDERVSEVRAEMQRRDQPELGQEPFVVD